MHAFISGKEHAVKSSSGPTRRTQSERRAATRGALLAAARELFAERGFAGVSREEIVERAGVTRGAMYHYFSSKEHLFEVVFEEVERDLCQAAADAASATTDPVEELRLGARAFLQLAGQGEVRRIAVLDAPAIVKPETRRRVNEQYALGLIQAVLLAIDDERRLAVGPPEALAPLLMASLHEAATQVADGADEAATIAVIDGLIDRLTKPRRRR